MATPDGAAGAGTSNGAWRARLAGLGRKLFLRLRSVLHHPVLISSTTATFQAEREAIRRHLFGLSGVEPVAFEHQSIQGRTPHEASVAYVDAAAVVVMLVGGGHGSVGKDTAGKSFTQLEAERAAASHKPLLLYVRRPPGHEGTFSELVDTAWEREALRSVEARAFSTPDELAAMVVTDVANTLRLYERVAFWKQAVIAAFLVALALALMPGIVRRNVQGLFPGAPGSAPAAAAEVDLGPLQASVAEAAGQAKGAREGVETLLGADAEERARLRRCADSYDEARQARWDFLTGLGLDEAAARARCREGERDRGRREPFRQALGPEGRVPIELSWAAVCDASAPMVVRVDVSRMFAPCAPALDVAWHARLKDLGQRLRAAAPQALEVVGYTDRSPVDSRACAEQAVTSNEQLSLLRARAIARVLEGEEVQSVQAYGAGVHPASAACPDQGENEAYPDYAARCLNDYRRAEILVRKREFWSRLNCVPRAAP